MAEIKIEEIVDHLSTKMRSALDAAAQEVTGGTSIDRHELFRAFLRAVRRKCSTWEKVPDRFVRVQKRPDY